MNKRIVSTKNNNIELWIAFFVLLVITALYGGMVAWQGIPPASGLLGHLIGVAGFILMLMTETLYSLRKRSRSARWGRTANWLKFHIFTGIVGPYMVLLHTAWRFNGLAGATLLMTILIVISGFIGRYIYTAVPRTVDGAEVESDQLQGQIRVLQSQLQEWFNDHPDVARLIDPTLLSPVENMGGGAALVFNRMVWLRKRRWQWNRLRRALSSPLREQARQLEHLILRQQELTRQVAALSAARRLLALWHAIHIPIGMALFTAAILHAAAAFYYATLMK